MALKQYRLFRWGLVFRVVAIIALFSLPTLLTANAQSLFGVGCALPNGDASPPITPIQTSVLPFEPLSRLTQSNVVRVDAASFGVPLADDETASLYPQSSVVLQAGDRVSFEVNISEAGDYTFTFDMLVPVSASRAEGQLMIDGTRPVPDLERIIFPVYYQNSTQIFPRDRYGNDALIEQLRDIRWSSVAVRDANYSDPYPLRIPLTVGTHQIEFLLTQGGLYLGSMYLTPFTTYPDYQTYLASHYAADTSNFSLTLEAELPTYKNDTSARPSSDRSLTVTPYDTYCQLMNVLGGETWDQSGTAVYYEFEVPQAGFYAITLHALQNTRTNFTVFRRITLNGEVPFAELNTVPFESSLDWLDVSLGGDTPYRLFLREGRNVLGIEVTNSPYEAAINTIQQALLDINTLALEIQRLTGNQRDTFREWNISDYIPDVQQRLNTIAQYLIDDKDTLGQRGGSREGQTYQMAIDNLLFLANNPNQIPIYMNRFSQGTGSAAQLLGSLLPLLQEQPLAIDRIVIHSPDVTPETPPADLFTSAVEGLKRFIYSFQPDPYRSLAAGEDELEVWVNRPRQYVNLLQIMADTLFTPQTGIRVRFSIMPDESRLVLANAAGIQPDVALGVSTNIPYELAIRNALYDLRSFPDFDSFIRVYSPGALVGYIIDDSVYAIPETQDFWVTYYRQDIMDSLGLPIPRTWPEVIEILPELQRYGMNYNTPLSSGAGQRNYLFTAPYLFNFDAPLYSENGYATGLASDQAVAGIRFMAESFTLYGMPLTTSSFFDSFRYGTLPIGISNYETYIKLMIAAPELGNQWGMDLYPATVLPDGSENRWTTGSAQTSLMFRSTKNPEGAWQFMRWWMSTETQAEFADQLILNYGREYLWFSANRDAFSQLDIPEQHRSVILEQWQWIQEPARMPGGYMQERELSNIWNRIVFDGINPRVAIDRSVIMVNREMTRRMEEFGYIVDGERVRELTVPTVDTVIGWVQNADQ